MTSISRKILSILLALFLVGLGVLAYCFIWKDDSPPLPEPIASLEIPTHTVPQLHIPGYQVGSFGPDEERKGYQSGTMTLLIPRLGYEGPVLSVDLLSSTQRLKHAGISEDVIPTYLAQEMGTLLDEGVVLFHESQLPGVENRNVSIAGHRDYKNMEFFYLDQLGAGDELYLLYNGYQYVYSYQETFITEEDNWDPIAVGEKSKLTLQSCDPPFEPNQQYKRIFVVAELVDVYPIDGTSFMTEETPPISSIESEESFHDSPSYTLPK